MDHNLDMFTIEPRTVYYLPGRCTNVQTLGLGSRGMYGAVAFFILWIVGVGVGVAVFANLPQ